MSVEEDNKAVFLKFFEDVWDGRLPEDVEWIAGLRAAFSDFTVTPDKVLAAEGGHVVIMFTMTGTHQQDYQDVPATGQPITVRGTTVARLEDGKIVDEFACLDKTGYDLRIW